MRKIFNLGLILFLIVFSISCEDDGGTTTTAPTYTVTYDGNDDTGGSAPTDSNNYEEGATVTVLANTEGLVKTGNTFVGWNTLANGTGTDYAASATFSMGSSDVTLYAKWTVNPTYIVTYDGNENAGGSAPTDSNNYEEGTTVTVLANTEGLVKTGNTFVGWNTLVNGTGTDYAASATFSMGSSDVTLYAKWTVNSTYTVTFDGNENTGGTVPTDNNNYEEGVTVTVLANTGNLIKIPVVGTGEAFKFGGWNTLANGSGTKRRTRIVFYRTYNFGTS